MHATYSRQLSLSPPSSGSHSLFDRYMNSQLRLAGGRRKLGRNGFRSDIPRECVDPLEYLRYLRDVIIYVFEKVSS